MNCFKDNYLSKASDSEGEESQETVTDDDGVSDDEAHSDEGECSDSSIEYHREKSELELLREKNIKERDAFLAMLMSDPEYADVVAAAKELKQQKVHKVTNPKKDPSYRFGGRIHLSLEIRRSSRLQNIPPVFCKEDLIDEIEINRKRKNSEEYDYYDLERVVFQPKKIRTRGSRGPPVSIIPVEEVTSSMIANIARKGTVKVYSDEGTSCHQCRQKTKDQKTCCRSNNCVGIRGQFCGVCLENRYGEDAAVALKNPTWECPVCRGICNCSFCRQKAGKRPTGILAPLAQQSGHKSVKDFLESLKGEGDYSHQDYIWQKLKDPKYLLGYSKDLKFVHMGGGVRHKIDYFLTVDKLSNVIWKEECKLESIIDLHDEPRNLLGFIEGTEMALMDDGTQCFMGSVYLNCKNLLQKIISGDTSVMK